MHENCRMARGEEAESGMGGMAESPLREQGVRDRFIHKFIRDSVVFSLLAMSVMACTKRIHTEIEISAPRDVVWKILADIDDYPKWNPYHLKVEGRLALGETLKVYIRKPNGEEVEIEPHVMVLNKLDQLSWGGGLRPLFYGRHDFILEEVAENKTRLIHKEVFEGLVVPFAALEAIDEGYDLMNRALKDWIEGGR